MTTTLRWTATLAALLIGGMISAADAQSEVLPDGFTLEPVFNGDFAQGLPVSFAFLPDQRILLIEKNTGVIRIHVPGTTAAPIIGVVPGVDGSSERGLLGIAVDPDWPARPYVYVYYTHNTSTGRVTMYTATGELTDPNNTHVSLASPYHVLADLPDNLAVHNGGTLRFGPDGALYLSLGDDLSGCNAQNTGILAGCILRLDVSLVPQGGTGPPPRADLVPAGNPLSGPTDEDRLQYLWGFRNPFRFSIDPATGDLAIGDVGLVTQEEINVVRAATDAGSNYGWPHWEGTIDPGNGLSCGIGNPFTFPVYTYPHGGIASVVGGPTYRAPIGATAPFPAEYEGDVFFGDFYQGFVRRLTFDGANWALADSVAGQPSATDWATGLANAADFQVGPDGSLYVVFMLDATGRDRGLYRIVSSGPTDAPLVASPAGDGPNVFPNPARPGDVVEIDWAGMTSRVTSVEILDVAGRRVRAWDVGGVDSPQITWDGRAGDRLAAPGVYFVRLTGPDAEVRSTRLVRLR
ncbi:MAG: PQQ-dependent sugar dehydrogenase [Gemmatimonadetes bacterium]|nr:PQQ-dependent sugar dehydrogenase [Gemmatimonadota bacterium]